MQTLAALAGESFNDIYGERPVWGIAANAVQSNSPVLSTFGEYNGFVPLNVEYSGNAKSRARMFPEEVSSNNQWFGAASQASTNTVSPPGGFFGISVCTQTGCLNNFDAYDNGNFGTYSATSIGAHTLAARSGIIVGESNWRQTFDLVLHTTGNIYKDQVGGGLSHTLSGNKPTIAMNSEMGPAFVNGGAGNWGKGQISHNRNTGRLLIAQPTAGASGTSLTFRLHFFDLQMKIGQATTVAQIKQAMKDATQTGAGRYRYADVVFSNAACFWSSNTTYDSADSEFVLCDNDEVWMFKSQDSAQAGSTYTNVLFRVNLTGGTYITGTYAATTVLAFAAPNNQYGATNDDMYGARHMNSDDNSVVALFQHNYYYCGGYNVAFVSTKTAGATAYNSTSQSGASAYTFAPSGGPNFVFCESSRNNDGGCGPAIGFANNETLAATNYSITCTGYLYSSPSSSTLYGANLVLKIQPTTEWK